MNNGREEPPGAFPLLPCTKPSLGQRPLPCGLVVTWPWTMDLSRWSTACLASAGRSGCSMSATTFHTASTACWEQKQREAGKLSSSRDLEPAGHNELWQLMIKIQGFHVWSSLFWGTLTHLVIHSYQPQETPNPVLHPRNWNSSFPHSLQWEHLCRNLHPATRWVQNQLGAAY